MKNSRLLIALALAGASVLPLAAGRNVTTLRDGWQFTHGRAGASAQWRNVRVPHDWAISGPFDIKNDLQTVRVEQNGETRASLKTGRTGGLPFIGQGTYRTTFEVPDTTGRSLTLLFDGAMSHARVFLNGTEVAYWPYGYNSFFVDLRGAVRPGSNDLTVELENKEKASRWYPGAGLYRNVHLINADRVHIPVWGTCVTTPDVSADRASVRLDMEIEGGRRLADSPFGEQIGVETVIISPQGTEVASDSSTYTARGQKFFQNFLVEKPQLWDTENPALYTARTELWRDGRMVDSYDTRFGIRKLEYLPEPQLLFRHHRPRVAPQGPLLSLPLEVE